MMGVKDAVKALLERLPDDCSVDDVIDRLYELQQPAERKQSTTALTSAQREELDRRLDALEREHGRTIPWEEVRRELERDE
jgi:putative addiction module component (TIGR02574 family)